MIEPGTLFLLDTSILLHLLRGKAAARAIDEAYGLIARPERVLVGAE